MVSVHPFIVDCLFCISSLSGERFTFGLRARRFFFDIELMPVLP